MDAIYHLVSHTRVYVMQHVRRPKQFAIGVITFVSAIVLSAVAAMMQPLRPTAAAGLSAVVLSLLIVVVLAWDLW